ncbi:MAG: hypothetical protein DME30_08825 [Verrucomicrobia bacterium]|nr:MAG: hypothetical protein DME30_08825 [Verrucomicrobiota bacterium]
MHTGRVSDLADYGILGKIDNDYFRGVREIKTARRRIDRYIIPAAFASDPNFVEKFVRLLRKSRSAQYKRALRR